ncbi:hypothetical protein BDW62DRAFT_195333 [Aspergillus aurantiobrunneus]
MPTTRVLPLFSIISDDSQSPDQNRCVALLEDGKRCCNLISECDLEDKYDRDDDILAELAKLCLCREAGHNTAQTVDEAIKQWKQQKTSSDLEDAAPSSLSTPEDRENNPGPLAQFKFERPKGTENIDPKEIDDRILGLLEEGNTADKPKCMYLMGHKAAKGLYKIGNKAKILSKLPYKSCYYPGWDLYYWVQCSYPGFVQQLVLGEFGAQKRIHRCDNSESSTHPKTHINWIEAPGEDIKASINAWSDLVKRDYSGVQLPASGFSTDLNRWTKWAQQTADSLKAPAAPTLPPRSTPVSHEHSDTSFTSATTASTEVPPSTPNTATETYESSTASPTGKVPNSPPRVRFKDYAKGKINSIIGPLDKAADSDEQKPPGLLDIGKGIVRNLVS